MFELKGKVAIVTGGNGGIGLGMARGLAAAGARVVVAARNEQKSQAALLELRERGSDAFAVTVDVTDERSVERLVADTNIRKPPQDLAVAEWHHVMDTNLTSAFLCSKSAHPHLKRSGGGKIINVGSLLSIFGASFAPAYGASKGGVVQLTKSLAAAWALDRIQVNALLPGWIDTELTRAARQQIAGLEERAVARTPAGRWGHIDDFAGVAVFLASSASDFITGAAIPVDGGYSILL